MELHVETTIYAQIKYRTKKRFFDFISNFSDILLQQFIICEILGSNIK